jgi:F-type H+-transporting ATPase subunit c
MERVAIIVCSVIAAVIIILTAMLSATTYDTRIAYTTLDIIGKKPELKSSLLPTMLISIGLIESIPIIATVIAIVLVIANPYLGK